MNLKEFLPMDEIEKYKNKHACVAVEDEIDYCNYDNKSLRVWLGSYGIAVNVCVEELDGTLWVGNNEYSNQVNFCPFCGFGAQVKLRVGGGSVEGNANEKK